MARRASPPLSDGTGKNKGIRPFQAFLDQTPATKNEGGGWVAPPQYLEGEIHPVWEKTIPYSWWKRQERLRFPSSGTGFYFACAGRRGGEERQAVGPVVRELVKKALPPLVAKWEPILGVHVKLFFRAADENPVGTCHTRKGTIRLNADLAQKPAEYLEYVLVHEMVHLLEPSHNARFYALMGRFMPDWKILRAGLNRRSNGLKEDF